MNRINSANSAILVVMVLQLSFFIFALWLGTVCVNYDIFHIWHKTIPTFWAFILNIVTGGFGIVVAIVIKVLSMFGIIH